MAVAIIANPVVVMAIALTIWLMLGRAAIGPNTGAEDHNQDWAPPGM